MTSDDNQNDFVLILLETYLSNVHAILWRIDPLLRADSANIS
jgi:hypothetical protein